MMFLALLLPLQTAGGVMLLLPLEAPVLASLARPVRLVGVLVLHPLVLVRVVLEAGTPGGLLGVHVHGGHSPVFLVLLEGTLTEIVRVAVDVVVAILGCYFLQIAGGVMLLLPLEAPVLASLARPVRLVGVL